MEWTKSTFQLVSTLIASGLAATAFTTLITIINQPNIDLNVIVHKIPINNSNYTAYYPMAYEPDTLDHFEVVFFFSIIKQVKPIVYGENITVKAENIRIANYPTDIPTSSNYGVPQVIVANVKRLAADAMMNVYVETEEVDNKYGSKMEPPYYVSATFDEGSKDKPSDYLLYPTEILKYSDIEGMIILLPIIILFSCQLYLCQVFTPI